MFKKAITLIMAAVMSVSVLTACSEINQDNDKPAANSVSDETQLSNITTVSKTDFIVGETVTVKGEAYGGNGEYFYEFYYKRNNSDKWTAFGKNGTAAFKPAAEGSFTIRTYAKDTAGHAAVKDFSLKASPAIVNKTTVSTTELTTEDAVKVKGAAAGGDGNYYYEFYVKKAKDNKWTSFGKRGEGTFKPQSTGDYIIRTYAKDKVGGADVKDFNIKVK